MKLCVNTKTETPLYVQLYNQIVAQIVKGAVPPHFCLPSIRVVAHQLEISVIPVKAAYEQLEREGFVYTLPGKGCFVAEVNKDKKFVLAEQRLKQHTDYCKELGLTDSEIMALTKKILEE